MATTTSALSVSGSRTSGQPVRTQNGTCYYNYIFADATNTAAVPTFEIIDTAAIFPRSSTVMAVDFDKKASQ